MVLSCIFCTWTLSSHTRRLIRFSPLFSLLFRLCGYPPFYNENDAILFETIMSGQFEFHSPYWDSISNEAKDLIRRLLVVHPDKRLSAKQALKHEWFQTKTSSSKKLHKNFHTELSRHNSRRKSAVRFHSPIYPTLKYPTRAVFNHGNFFPCVYRSPSHGSNLTFLLRSQKTSPRTRRSKIHSTCSVLEEIICCKFPNRFV